MHRYPRAAFHAPQYANGYPPIGVSTFAGYPRAGSTPPLADRYPRVGLFGIVDIPILDDIGEWTLDQLESVGQWINGNIPGAQWLSDVVSAAAKAGENWIVEFARSPVGRFTLKLIANNVAPYVGRLIAPAAMAVVFAAPGMAAGDSFTKALADDTTARLEALATFATTLNPWAAGATYYGVPELAMLGGEARGKAVAERYASDLASVTEGNSFVRNVVEPFADQISNLNDSDAQALLKSRGADPVSVVSTVKLINPKTTLRPDQVAIATNVFLGRRIYVPTQFDVMNGYPPGQSPAPAKPEALPIVLDDILSSIKRSPTSKVPGAHVDTASTAKDGVSFVTQKRSFVGNVLVLGLVTAPFWLPTAYEHASSFLKHRR